MNFPVEMISNLSEDGRRKLVAHLQNLREAVFFITNNADDCIRLDDEQIVDLRRADKVAKVIESFTSITTE